MYPFQRTSRFVCLLGTNQKLNEQTSNNTIDCPCRLSIYSPLFMKLNGLIFSLFISVLIVGCDGDEEGAPVQTAPLLLSYETDSGVLSMKAAYEYNLEEKVSKITWERATPGITKGADVFEYDSQGRLKKQIRSITGLVDETIEFTWDGNVIFASATYSNNQKIAYSFYDYDNKNQLKIIETYRKESSYGYLRTDSIGFTYHSDGNLFKMLHYAYSSDLANMIRVSTKTFSDYLTSPNPISTVEVLPVLSLQKNLPTQYLWEGMDSSLPYTFEYDLRTDGYPNERTVHSSSGDETTIYKYKE